MNLKGLIKRREDRQKRVVNAQDPVSLYLRRRIPGVKIISHGMFVVTTNEWLMPAVD